LPPPAATVSHSAHPPRRSVAPWPASSTNGETFCAEAARIGAICLSTPTPNPATIRAPWRSAITPTSRLPRQPESWRSTRTR